MIDYFTIDTLRKTQQKKKLIDAIIKHARETKYEHEAEEIAQAFKDELIRANATAIFLDQYLFG